jgi:hypothetical protein
MKNKKHYHVVSEGLNQFGVDELNKFYEFNIKLGYIKEKFVVGDVVAKASKKFRQINQFGPDSYWGNLGCQQVRTDIDGNEIKDRLFGDFGVELKHLNYKVYEVNETYTEVEL